MNPFAAAASKAKAPQSKSRKDVYYIEPDEQLKVSVDSFVAAKQAMSEHDAKKKEATAKITPAAVEYYTKEYASKGTPPDKVVMKGVKHEVDIIVQDRSGQYACSDEKLAALTELIGPTAESLIAEETVYSFDTSILMKDGVIGIISEAIERTVQMGILTVEQKNQMLNATAKRVIKKGVLDRIGVLCNNDAVKMRKMVDILGTDITIYPK